MIGFPNSATTMVFGNAVSVNLQDSLVLLKKALTISSEHTTMRLLCDTTTLHLYQKKIHFLHHFLLFGLDIL